VTIERFDQALPQGITLSCRACGPREAPLRVLLLHGFPEGAFVWDEVMQRLGPALRCVAPNLRGYERSNAPTDVQAYRAKHLVGDFVRLWPFFTHMGGVAWLTDALRAQYRVLWQQGLEGPLNYYRASPLKPPISAADAIHSLVFAPEFVTVRVPTTVLWGEADRALPLALLDGLEAYVEALDVRRVAGASHWIVHEQPALVAETIEQMIRPPHTGP